MSVPGWIIIIILTINVLLMAYISVSEWRARRKARKEGKRE